MASSFERSDNLLGELEQMAGALEDELAAWRKRSLKAEADLEALRKAHEPPSNGGALGVLDVSALRDRVVALEQENHTLKRRIDQAREQLQQLKTRLQFVGDQVVGDIG